MESPDDRIHDLGMGIAWISARPDFGNHYCHLMTPNSRSCFHDHASTLSLGGIAYTTSSQHPGGVNIAMADGSVRFVSDHIDSVTWWALGSRDGGETIGEF
jgi:prepilin-type processing-associated H-X9-DG protein